MKRSTATITIAAAVVSLAACDPAVSRRADVSGTVVSSHIRAGEPRGRSTTRYELTLTKDGRKTVVTVTKATFNACRSKGLRFPACVPGDDF